MIDASLWTQQTAATKGTRQKVILSPEGSATPYFLKFPMVRPGRDYSPETWSEILVSQIGNALGFNVLKYDFAIYNGRNGCISQSMVDDGEDLIEGNDILSGFDPSYNPSDKNSYSKYTFDFVLRAIAKFNCTDQFVEMLVLDAIIGNSDRHQSNWGLIRHGDTYSFAPIYDSGCCLGRELSENAILDYLDQRRDINTFIRKGTAELRIDAKGKVNHFALLRHIGRTHPVSKIINRTLKNYNKQAINNIISSVDADLPENLRQQAGLSTPRKTFIARLIDLRIQQLSALMMPQIKQIDLVWRNGSHNPRIVIGTLAPDLTFNYTSGIDKACQLGLACYPAFPDTKRTYNQNITYIISQRLLDPTRDDIRQYYDFWEVAPDEQTDPLRILAHTSGSLPTDNFEWLVEYTSAINVTLVSDLAGLSEHPLVPGTLHENDTLTWAKAPHPDDPLAIQVLHNGHPIGYIKQVHNRLFHAPGADRLVITVKKIEHNGHINKVFMLIKYTP